MTSAMRRLTDIQRASLLDRLRTVFPPVAGFLASNVTVWAVRKGIPLTEAQALGLITTLGGLLWKVIASFVNPNDAAAPSMVKQNPTAPYQGASVVAANPPGPQPTIEDGIVIPRPTFTREESSSVAPTPTPEPEKKPPARKRAPRKKKEPSDVVKLRRSTDVPPPAEGDPPTGFGDYVPTAKDLPRNISPRPKLTSDDQGIV